MKKIDNGNYKRFLEYYNDFHDSYIRNIDYNTDKSEINITFDVWSNGRPVLKENSNYEENQTRLSMVFKEIDKFSENNPYMINYIDYTYIEFYNQNDKNLICFALNSEDPDEEPYLYIVCENIEYEVI